MNINRLIEIIEPQVSRQNYSGSFKGADDHSDYESKDSMSVDKGMVGRGYFSTVAADKKDPHMVKKYTTNFNSDDVFDLYVRFIIKNKLHENPYFPRIYNFKEIQDKKGKTLHKFQIEKLVDLEQLSEDEIEHIYRVIFEEPEHIEKNATQISIPPHIKEKDRKKRKKLIQLSKQIREAVNRNMVHGFKDENLVEAVRELHYFMNNECKNCHNDMHAGNFMARRTPYGAQLVITDPVSASGSASGSS